MFPRAVDELVDFVERLPPVLVQCHAGRSRSVVLVAAYFMRTQRLDPEDASTLVCSKREASLTSGIELLLDHV